MKSVNDSDRRVVNIHNAQYRQWEDEPGQSVLQLNTAQPDGVGFHIFKMDPGVTTTAHEHTEDEEFLVLSGDLTDNDGTEYREGDLVWMKKGTQHCSTTKNGCLLAVFIRTAEVPV